MPETTSETRWTRVCCIALLGLALTAGGCGGSSGGNQKDSGPTQSDSSVPQQDGGGGGDGPIANDGPIGDGGGDGGAGIAGHGGTAIMSGAVQAKSTKYKVIMSTGQSPGGNNTAASSTYKARGGLVGATQGR